MISSSTSFERTLILLDSVIIAPIHVLDDIEGREREREKRGGIGISLDYLLNDCLFIFWGREGGAPFRSLLSSKPRAVYVYACTIARRFIIPSTCTKPFEGGQEIKMKKKKKASEVLTGQAGKQADEQRPCVCVCVCECAFSVK
jgi:hypothetical protein